MSCRSRYGICLRRDWSDCLTLMRPEFASWREPAPARTDELCWSRFISGLHASPTLLRNHDSHNVWISWFFVFFFFFLKKISLFHFHFSLFYFLIRFLIFFTFYFTTFGWFLLFFLIIFWHLNFVTFWQIASFLSCFFDSRAVFSKKKIHLFCELFFCLCSPENPSINDSLDGRPTHQSPKENKRLNLTKLRTQVTPIFRGKETFLCHFLFFFSQMFTFCELLKKKNNFENFLMVFFFAFLPLTNYFSFLNSVLFTIFFFFDFLALYKKSSILTFAFKKKLVSVQNFWFFEEKCFHFPFIDPAFFTFFDSFWVFYVFNFFFQHFSIYELLHLFVSILNFSSFFPFSFLKIAFFQFIKLSITLIQFLSIFLQSVWFSKFFQNKTFDQLFETFCFFFWTFHLFELYFWKNSKKLYIFFEKPSL